MAERKMIKITLGKLRKIIRESITKKIDAWWITPDGRSVPLENGLYHDEVAAQLMGKKYVESRFEDQYVLSYMSMGAIRVRLYDGAIYASLNEITPNSINQLKTSFEELGINEKTIVFLEEPLKRPKRTTVINVLLAKTERDL